MALTPDDVVHKQFQHVRFKDGFDPDEVDDYLDEIVVEWRKTIEENNQLKARIAELEAAAAAAPVVAEPIFAEPAAPEPVAVAPEPVVAAAPVASAPAVTTGDESAAVDASTGIIAIAQRVHDEYVAEGQARSNQIVADAEARAAQIVSQAEARQREELGRLSEERSSLEAKIKDLREFESTYRTQLRSYFEGQLNQLNSEQLTTNAAPAFGQ